MSDLDFLHLDSSALGMLSVSEICIFFGPQYLLNGLVSDFDFLLVDKY